jgi:uncharacterized protein YjbJ (UPF0337 family)
MKNNIWESNWDQIAGEIKSKWGSFTEDDIAKAKGDSQVIVGLLKERYSMEKDKAAEELASFVENIKDKLKEELK